MNRLEERDDPDRLRNEIEGREHILGAARSGHDDRPERLPAVPRPRLLHGSPDRPNPVVGIAQVARVEANIEAREVKAEDLDTPTQAGETTVRDPPAAVLPEAAVENREISRKLGCRCEASLVTAFDHVHEAPPDERELSTIGLLGVAPSDFGEVLGELLLVCSKRCLELLGDTDEARRDGQRTRELPHLVPIPREDERSRLPHRLLDGVRAGCGIPVGVAPDPAPEPQRARSAREPLSNLAERLLGRIDEAVLEEPQQLTDLVDHPRPSRPHLVRLPEKRDLLGELPLDVLSPLEPSEQLAEPQMGGECRAPGRFRGMRREHELERDIAGCARNGRRVCAGVRDTVEGGTKGLPCNATLLSVAPPPARPVMLLGDVGQLEVDGERPEDARLARREKAPYFGDDVRRARDFLPRIARAKADPLDRRQQLLTLLLDDDLPEQPTEDADISPKRVGAHARQYRPTGS